MRVCLHLTLPELESGNSIQVGSKDRIGQLKHLSSQGWPVAISPIVNHQGQSIAAVLLTEEAIDRTGKGNTAEIKFRPIWCRSYVLCHSGRKGVAAVIIECSSGKYWIDTTGVREMNNITTSGEGCDPQIVKNAEIALGNLLFEGEDHPEEVISRTINFLKKEF